MNNETRNNYQQYDWIEVFKSFETKIKRGIHVATMAVVMSVDGDTLQCMPFPTEEGTNGKVIEAYNIANATYARGDKCLVLFTDRDFRTNRKNVTIDSNSVTKTNNATLHSDLYGIVIPTKVTSSGDSNLEVYNSKSDFPSEGDSNKLYFSKEDDIIYSYINNSYESISIDYSSVKNKPTIYTYTGTDGIEIYSDTETNKMVALASCNTNKLTQEYDDILILDGGHAT